MNPTGPVLWKLTWAMFRRVKNQRPRETVGRRPEQQGEIHLNEQEPLHTRLCLQSS